MTPLLAVWKAAVQASWAAFTDVAPLPARVPESAAVLVAPVAVWVAAGAAVSFDAQPTRLTAAVAATRAEAMRMILTEILRVWSMWSSGCSRSTSQTRLTGRGALGERRVNSAVTA